LKGSARVAPLGNRNDAVAHQELQLQAVGEQGHLGKRAGLDQRQAEEVGQQARQVGLGDEPEPGQHQVEPLARLALGALRPVQREFVENPARRQEGREPLDEVGIGRVDGPVPGRGALVGHGPFGW
jgi:hypothetical protein